VAGLRQLRERLQRAGIRVAQAVPILGRELARVGDRWAELEVVPDVQPNPSQESYLRLFEELGRVRTALKAVWEPSPPEMLDTHDDLTFGQLRYSVGFTRRRLGPRSEPDVRRMRQLTGELAKLRKGLELACAPIYGDYKLGSAGELSDGSWATFDLDFARVRERLYDIAGSLNHVVQSGPDGVGPPVELLEPRRLLEANGGTAPEPLTPPAIRVGRGTRRPARYRPPAMYRVCLAVAASSACVDSLVTSAYADVMNQRVELELTESAASSDPDIGLRAVASLRTLTEQLEVLQVDNARALEWSWQEIAARLGVTKQTVHRKHGRRRRS
jgi:hypothetical protein